MKISAIYNRVDITDQLLNLKVASLIFSYCYLYILISSNDKNNKNKNKQRDCKTVATSIW